MRLHATALLLPSLVSAPHGCGDHPSCNGNHTLRVNPLKGLPPLPKVHYSWAIYPPFLDNTSVAHGVLVDYVRITGALTPTDTLQTTHGARTAVAICAKASAMDGCLKVESHHRGLTCRAFHTSFALFRRLQRHTLLQLSCVLTPFRLCDNHPEPIVPSWRLSSQSRHECIRCMRH